MNKLLVVGTVAYDAIETPYGKTDKILGGAATYIGLSAAHFNVDTAIVSVVGEDFEKEHIELLQSKDINTESIEVIKGGKTFFWSGKYSQNMNHRETLDTQLNVLENFSPKVSEAYKDSKVVLLGNLHPLVQLSVLDQLDGTQKLTILDTMNFWMDIALEDLKKVIARVDVICINDEEARQLSGQYALVTAAKVIQEMGPKTVIIKKGEHGALLFSEGHVFSAPAYPLEKVFDPTGAGDTFLGGFGAYLAHHTENLNFETMKTAIIYGSNLASFCVERFGTERMSTLTENEVKERLEAFKTLTEFQIELPQVSI